VPHYLYSTGWNETLREEGTTSDGTQILLTSNEVDTYAPMLFLHCTHLGEPD
jgi:hypothetical protein